MSFPVIGYNIGSDRIYCKVVGGDGKVSLILANEVLPQGVRASFEIPVGRHRRR